MITKFTPVFQLHASGKAYKFFWSAVGASVAEWSRSLTDDHLPTINAGLSPVRSNFFTWLNLQKAIGSTNIATWQSGTTLTPNINKKQFFLSIQIL